MPEGLNQKLNPQSEVFPAQKDINLFEFGVGVGSKLEETLNKQDKDKIKGMLLEISRKAEMNFGKHRELALHEIFSCLSEHPWLYRCESPNSFLHSAETVMDIVKLHMRYNPRGEIEDYQDLNHNEINMEGFLMLNLASGSDRSLDTLRSIIKDSYLDQFGTKNDVVGQLWTLNHHGLSLPGRSLELILDIVKKLVERNIDIKSQFKLLFGDTYAKDTGKKDDKGHGIYESDDTFKKMCAVSKAPDSSLENYLKVVCASYHYDNDIFREHLLSELNKMDQDHQGLFISKARKLLTKGITPGLLMNKDDILGTFDFDLSKSGLDMVPECESQGYKNSFKKSLLQACIQFWQDSPESVAFTSRFYNDALSPRKTEKVFKKEFNVSKIKGYSGKELRVLQEDVDEELGASEVKITNEVPPDKELQEWAREDIKYALEMLYKDKKFETISKIKSLIPASAELISALDQEQANQLMPGNLIKFITSLGSEKEEILPLTFAKAREMISTELIQDLDLADYFFENLDKYCKQPWVAENMSNTVKHYSIAVKFISVLEDTDTSWKNEPWVSMVSEQAKAVITEYQKEWDENDNNDTGYKYRHGNEGFSGSDPYEKHEWLFDSKQAHLVSVLSGAMTTKRDDVELEKLGISKEDLADLMAEINENLNSAYNDFINQIRSNSHISQEDRDALINPEVVGINMTPLFDTVRNLVIRYLVQSVGGDITRVRATMGQVKYGLSGVIAEGFEKYIKVNEVDIPLYDKLYDEFDNLRETGRYPLEVYLGRDGIYAWIGRRAQDVSRRRKLGPEGRKKLKKQGEIIAINPQYTVYPRYFRDNINYETKREFLEQEGISPDADPLFYDTGYTGTIPEQMMRVMDFNDEDIEKRIRLLSAPSAHRRVKGIAENARSEIIEYIEHNAKTEDTAVGLIKDSRTGRIRHVAEPTSPQEQFNYMMVKQAIARHYWLKEKLHHEPSGNVNLDSEHYIIRIRQEYAKLLPQEFVHDPKTYFTKHGELLKGSKGEGEYPDEEVVLFKLEDGTEIVAKRIELRKAKEAKKEFSILIAAKKAGLPTADPVGFLSGKTDADSSYLLMKKLEGLSGRNFDTQLRDMGKFTEEQIVLIMKTVADKNKDVAELFRTTLKIDKRWRIKDTIIEFNQETGEVESVTPIDWERAQNYNPQTPKEIDEN